MAVNVSLIVAYLQDLANYLENTPVSERRSGGTYRYIELEYELVKQNILNLKRFAKDLDESLQ